VFAKYATKPVNFEEINKTGWSQLK